MILALMSLVGAAWAGDGPWTLAPGELNLYLGASHYNYSWYDDGGGESSLGGAALTATHSVAVLTAGLLPALEAELRVPWETIRVDDRSAAMCGSGDFCAPSRGLGDVEGHLKCRLLDEFYLSPVSGSAGLSVRSGEAYAAERDRLTTLGDGQTDLGAGLALGRTESVGGGWYRANATGRYWYRLPNAASEGGRALGDEVSYSVEGAWSPSGAYSVGAAAYGFHRLWGDDISSADWSDPDVFASLRAAQIQVGPRFAIFTGGPTVTFAALRTVHARNNPSDTTVFSAGVGWFRAAPEAQTL